MFDRNKSRERAGDATTSNEQGHGGVEKIGVVTEGIPIYYHRSALSTDTFNTIINIYGMLWASAVHYFECHTSDTCATL